MSKLTTSRNGLILSHTGPGKEDDGGAAYGRPGCGRWMRVRVLEPQFLKGSWHDGELDSAEALSREDGFTYVIRQMGRGVVKRKFVLIVCHGSPLIRNARLAQILAKRRTGYGAAHALDRLTRCPCHRETVPPPSGPT